MISSNRPLAEMLCPIDKDQLAVFEMNFKGMTEQAFTYEEYEETRQSLIQSIHNILTETDKQFLLSIEEVNPNWTIYDFRSFPAVQWKLQNLSRLKSEDPEKHLRGVNYLKEVLNQCVQRSK